MKKYSILCCLLLSIFLMSCDKEDSDPTETKLKMQGLWNITYIEYRFTHSQNKTSIGEDYIGNKDMFYQFNEDGSASVHKYLKSYEFDYHLSEKSNFIVTSDSAILKCVIDQLDNDKFIFTAHHEFSKYGTPATYKYYMERY